MSGHADQLTVRFEQATSTVAGASPDRDLPARSFVERLDRARLWRAAADYSVSPDLTVRGPRAQVQRYRQLPSIVDLNMPT